MNAPHHFELGEPHRTWTYFNADGTPFCGVARWDWPDRDKKIRQFHVNGKGVEWKRPEGSRLSSICLNCSTVAHALVVAGEKAADAAKRLFPGWSVTTNLGGENAAEKTDWSVLRGKHVTIWRDADAAGEKWEPQVARLALTAGAAGVLVVEIPLSAPKGWDLADDVPDGWRLDEMIENAVEYRNDEILLPMAVTDRAKVPLPSL
jgi:putative DNA primase/helicase